MTGTKETSSRVSSIVIEAEKIGTYDGSLCEEGKRRKRRKRRLIDPASRRRRNE